MTTTVIVRLTTTVADTLTTTVIETLTTTMDETLTITVIVTLTTTVAKTLTTTVIVTLTTTIAETLTTTVIETLHHSCQPAEFVIPNGGGFGRGVCPLKLKKMAHMHRGGKRIVACSAKSQNAREC